jgi:4-hydroxy-2-oxoheptanedioate aldolase
MNSLEKKMVEHLSEMKEKYHVTSLKAEFEAEGSRIEEIMRLKEVSSCVGLDMTLKIGGCESKRDMFDSINIGVNCLVAPMVETDYALKKYLSAIKSAFPEDLLNSIEFLINMETKTAFQNLDKMFQVDDIDLLAGFVIGRVDMTGSLGLDRDSINGDEIFAISKEIAEKVRAKGKKLVIGGGVSIDAKPFFQALGPTLLDRFETRKVVFSCPGALDNPEEAFLKAVEFEIMWLKNKKQFYGFIHFEDDARLNLMESRYQSSIAALQQK